MPGKLKMKIETKYGSCEFAIESDYAHIFNLYVLPQYRRQGRAGELLRMAMDEIEKQGWTGPIEIVAQPTENSISKLDLIAFYEKLGLDVYEYYG